MKKILKIAFIASFVLSLTNAFAVSYDSSSLTNKVSQNRSLADSFFRTFSEFVNDLCFEELDKSDFTDTSSTQEENSDEYSDDYSENSDYDDYQSDSTGSPEYSDSYGSSDENYENQDEDNSSEDYYSYEIYGSLFEDTKNVLNFISDSAEIARDIQDGYQTISPLMNTHSSKSLFNLKFKTSLDAVYYTGFNINTDYGSQEGSLVQGYSDLLLGLKILDAVTLAFGTAGSRYGVFLTGIDFNIPSNDPVSNITVNDFMGTQIMTDIYCGVLGIKDFIWLGGYFFSSANYAPEENGLLSSSKESSVDYWGLKGQISSLIAADLLFDKKFNLQSFDWSFDAWMAALFLLQKPLNYNFSLSAGMAWYTKEELSPTLSSKTISKINWNRFDLPLDLHYSFENNCNYAYLEGNLSLSVSDTFKNFYLGKASAGVTADHLFAYYHDAHYYYYRIGLILKGSYYQDENLKYHGNSDSTQVFGVQAGLSISPGMDRKFIINASWRYNYLEDLLNLIEAKDKHVFQAYITLGL
ncbi:MAG: hypothetical protein K6E78_04325 [Treponema sp.]|nr:hypothetical protein [Treponema sp.]